MGKQEEPKGALYIIGGHEDKEGDCAILAEVTGRAQELGGAVVIVTVASQLPEKLAEEYIPLFEKLGAPKVKWLDIRVREQANDEANLEQLDEAAAIFFTGGDQLRITSQIGASPLFQRMQEIYHRGGLIVGTSAGAAAMPETMLIGGAGDTSHTGASLSMAPGLGFLSGVVIDSHFAERGRISRLLTAVAQNPYNLGIGIDEDTAIVVENGEPFHVIGSGAVYVLDGSEISYSSLSEEDASEILSIYDAKVHLLARGDCFDMAARRPILSREKEEELG